MKEYLQASEFIDYQHPAVAAKAAALAAGCENTHAVIKACFEFVRDEIRHSWDFQCGPVTCRASEVLQHRVGYCYAKSHLLAALLRANGIATGLCYQRLSVGTSGPPYCLHGLNAVWLPEQGWYRLDARGNKPGVAAEFCPPVERLAFLPLDPMETDLPGVWPEPLPLVVEALHRYQDFAELAQNLPDLPAAQFPLPAGVQA